MITTDQYQALLRQDFATFVRRCFAELWPTTKLKWNWHLDLIAARLDAVRRGECRRLIINVPPRSGKSLITSIAFPAFLLGHDPTAQIVGISYAQDLSEKFSADCRRIMLSNFYKRTFATRLASRRPALRELVTTAGGVRLATSVGGTLTGRGGDVLLLHDPLKPVEAMSDITRAAANAWFDSTLLSRLNDKEDGAIVLTMQRLHEDDLVGHVLRQGKWEVLSFPAIAEEEEVHEIRTIFGARTHHRTEGEALHPDRESLDRLAEARVTMGSYHFSAQYQQRPAPAGGGIVKRAWFRSYDPQAKPDFRQIVQSWDTASKASQLSDYSVCTTWGETAKGDIYLLDVYRAKLEYPDLKRKLKELGQYYRANTILIEECASGIQLLQESRQDGLYLRAIVPKGDKVMRCLQQTPVMEAGRVYLPAEAHWREAWLHEHEMFPFGRHDDQVDSTSQALAHIQEAASPQAWLDYFDRRLEEIQKR